MSVNPGATMKPVNGDDRWIRSDGAVIRQRCKAETSKGHRCKNSATLKSGEFCWQHDGSTAGALARCVKNIRISGPNLRRRKWPLKPESMEKVLADLCELDEPGSTLTFLLAEYCPHDLFMGWWLYERSTNDGRPDSRGGWGWLQDEWQRQPLRDLCLKMGSNPPEDGRNSQALAEWFADLYPNGLQVESGAEGYILVQRCTSRPRQRRGVVRTIRAATAADRAADRRSDLDEAGGEP